MLDGLDYEQRSSMNTINTQFYLMRLIISSDFYSFIYYSTHMNGDALRANKYIAQIIISYPMDVLRSKSSLYLGLLRLGMEPMSDNFVLEFRFSISETKIFLIGIPSSAFRRWQKPILN